jgi:hypothetical protein
MIVLCSWVRPASLCGRAKAGKGWSTAIEKLRWLGSATVVPELLQTIFHLIQHADQKPPSTNGKPLAECVHNL